MIEVAIKKSEPPKDRGDLLEDVCEKLLKAQNYKVIKEIRNTGVEVDLLCENKVNTNKSVYVECKAFRDKKIGSEVIWKLIGIKSHKKYVEAWLISTSEYGKEAKGLIKEKEGEGENSYCFFTPEKFIQSLVDCGEIESSSISKREVAKVVGNKNIIGQALLLITKYGVFWAFEYLKGGKPVGAILTYAKDSEVVKDASLLEEISNTDTSLNELDFLKIFSLSDSLTDKNGRLVFTDLYLERILDTGVKFTHPKKESLNIDDVFVYQDLQEMNGDNKINSLSLIKVKKDGQKVVLFGDDVSGKTTLAYKFQRSFVEQNMMPVYLNASWIKSSDELKFRNLILSRIKKQYKNIQNKDVDEFDKSKLVILIDDYQSLGLNKESSIVINDILSEKFSNVYIFSNISEKLRLMTVTYPQELTP